MNQYKELIMETLQNDYDKVTYVSEDHYIGYIEPLDEVHRINAIPVWEEFEHGWMKLKGIELQGERASIGHKWEIAYLDVEGE